MKSISLRVSRLSALASVLCTATLPVLAQTVGPNRLDSVFVTATRSPQRLADVLADVTLITRADIERQAFGGIADLLRNNGCAEITRNGGPAANASLFLRGADTRHTLVLIDGMRVDSQATGGASWQALPLSQIERIEVLKGPASAIYGSDAIGGVVQIFTRKGGNRLSLDLGAAVGNLGTKKLDGSIFGTIGPNGMFDYAVSAAAERSDGFNATLDLPGSFSYVPDRDGYRNHNASVRLGGQLSKDHRIEVMALQSRVDGQYDGSKSKPLLDDHSIQDTKAASANWSARWVDVGLPALQTQLTFGQSSERYETKPSPYLTETKLRNISLNGSYEFSKSQQLNFVLERREDELQNSGLTTANGTDKRNQNALALGYLWNGGPSSPFSLQAHARHDDDSQFGGVDTGTLAAGYLLTPGLRLVGSAGTAFRAPTLYQRGSVYGPDLTKAGVAPLAAENGRNLELGLKLNAGMSDAAITAYRNRVRDLITFGAAGSCLSNFGCYQNVSEALLQGVSISGGTQIGHGLGNTRLSATLDLQAPKDASTGKLLARRARQYGTVRADTQLASWNFGVGVQASGQRYDNAANTKPLAGYALLNLDAQFAINRELKLQFNLDNAFDRAYQTAGGYAQAPRTVMLGLRYSPSL